MNHVDRVPGWVRLGLCVVLGWMCLSSLGCSTSIAEDPSEQSTPGQDSVGHLTVASTSQEEQWSATGAMASTRLLHTATRLGDGRVLVVGGYNRSTELYDPDTGTWSAGAEALNTHRAGTATLLANGRVLVVGVGGAEWNSGISTEEYDPARGRWEVRGNLGTPRLYHTATLLGDGRVLVTGGADSEYGGRVLATAEIYDSATGTWSPTSPMVVARRNHTATLLSNGKVLVTGGSDGSGQLQSSAEVYDVASGTWSPVVSMAVGRAYHTATRLSNSKVLVAGGGSSDWNSSASAELFNPTTGTWEATASMSKPRRFHTATLLPSGEVLVAGGFHEYTGILTVAEVYDPALGAWRFAGNLGTGRYTHTATLMTGSRVLVAGGFSNGDQASAEVYTAPLGPPAPEQPTEPAGTSVLLEVVDTAGNPIPGAIVTSQGTVYPVDSAGHRLFENLPGRFLARVDAIGFTSATAVAEVAEGGHVGSRVKLLPLGMPLAFQAEQGGTVQTEQVRVTLPPNAVVDGLGQPISGTVQVTITPLDPTSQLGVMPGPLEGLPTWGSQQVQLESLFMAEVSLWSNGAPAQLAWGASATLEFVLPAAVAGRVKAGDTVPAWWFDLDAGHWREEGAGTIQPSSSQPNKLSWVTQVSHFTWWNSDYPWTDKSCVNVHVLDALGAPVADAPVSAQGVSYTGFIYPQYTNSSGQACIQIKRGNTANVFAGLVYQPTTSMVTVTGTQEAAACGIGPCTEVNLILPGVICRPGASQACSYSGQPPSTQGRGVCRAGVRQCNVTGTQWSACQGEVLPAQKDDCRTPFDDNCDGVVNDGCTCAAQKGVHCYTGPSGTEGVGICHGGTIDCGMFGVICANQQLPLPEACSTSVDENCDGVSEPCNPGPSGWASTGFMTSPRYWHTATWLPNGKVLVAGGIGSSGGSLATAEVYDPITGTWTATASMALPRYGHTATLLSDGKVLVAGGYGSSGPLATAEVYDPAKGTWRAALSMASPRYWHTATLLPNGKLLVAGGAGSRGDLATAEVYDPVTSTWSVVATMASPRASHTATLLPNGKVLVAGGIDRNFSLATAELYDSATSTWSVVGTMASPRISHTATLLSNGKVLVAGGWRNNDNILLALATAEVYDPVTGAWSIISSMVSPRYDHTATLLPNGKLLIAGGATLDSLPSMAEVYDPATSTWSPAGIMVSPRYRHTATLLPSGKVLVTGGYGSAAAEVYTR